MGALLAFRLLVVGLALLRAAALPAGESGQKDAVVRARVPGHNGPTDPGNPAVDNEGDRKGAVAQGNTAATPERKVATDQAMLEGEAVAQEDAAAAELELEEALSALLERAEGQPLLPLVPGLLTLERLGSEGRAEPLSSGSLHERLQHFLSSHALRLRLPGAAPAGPEEGRGRLRRLLIPFVLLLKLVEVVLLSVFMSGIALVSFKGLWAGLAAGLLAGAVGLKDLLAPHGHSPGWPSSRLALLRPHVLTDHVYHGGAGDLLHHGWGRTAPAPALDPYRGYGPSGASAAAWEARPLLL